MIRELYGSILRLHRRLPSADLRILGDEYVKKEFRDHVKSATPEQLRQFAEEWTRYRQTLQEQLRADRLPGLEIDGQIVLSDEQKLDLQRLKQAASAAK